METEFHNDCVNIYDGDSITSTSLGHYCGEHFPGIVKSSGPNVLITFITDINMEFKGFELLYTSKPLAGISSE